jgi:RNA polymerase sigma-70 factor (ECF subfamily)
VVYNSEEILVNIPDAEDSKNERELLKMEAQRLVRVLDAIKPDEKAILLMKYQDECSIAEIAQALEISESATKMRIKRSRAKVVELYQKLFSYE